MLMYVCIYEVMYYEYMYACGQTWIRICMYICVFIYIYGARLKMSMYECIYMCHKGVVSQTISSIVHAQGTSLQHISNQKKTNDEAFL